MITCIVASHGAPSWKELGKRAVASAQDQGFDEVMHVHIADATLAQARNRGAELAKSPWLLFLDADDELEPGYGDAMRAALTEDPCVLYTPAVIYQRNSVRPAPKIWPRMDFKTGNWCVIGTLISKMVFMGVGGFREYELYEDYALWAMAEKQFMVHVVEVPAAVYVAHYARKSRNRAPSLRERVYWHQKIGNDVWPEHFDDLLADEDATHQLATSTLRFR